MKALKYISIVLVLLTFSQCRTLEEYNVSPNSAEVGSIAPQDMMDELICNGALNYQQRFYDTFAELMQYTVAGASSNQVIHRYFFAPSYIENCWDNCAKWAANADHMYDLAVAAEQPNYQAIALTLRAMWMDQLTAIFGMVPFSEAFLLRDEDLNKPKFDNEKDIYTQLIKDLDLANSLYNTGMHLSSPGKDKLFNGKTEKWQKFTNSLQLRILMRLSNRSTEMEIAMGKSIAQKIHYILDNPAIYPLMSSYEDNACVYFSGESPFQNGWGGYNQNTLSGHRGAEYFIAQLVGKNDPRRWLWFIPWSKPVGWMGALSGMPGDETSTTGYPIMNYNIFLSYKLPVSFMNYDEVCFIKAEAYYRTDDDHWAAKANSSVAAYWYNEGIRQSCQFWRHIYCDWFALDGYFAPSQGTAYRDFTAVNKCTSPTTGYELIPVIDDAAIDNYINSTSVAFDVRKGIECIMREKYIANFRVMTEAYNDYRRTGFPQLAIGTGTQNNGQFPTRLVYPTKTKTTNPDSYQAVLDQLRSTYYDGNDDMLTPVWWSALGLSKEIR